MRSTAQNQPIPIITRAFSRASILKKEGSCVRRSSSNRGHSTRCAWSTHLQEQSRLFSQNCPVHNGEQIHFLLSNKWTSSAWTSSIMVVSPSALFLTSPPTRSLESPEQDTTRNGPEDSIDLHMLRVLYICTIPVAFSCDWNSIPWWIVQMTCCI